MRKKATWSDTGQYIRQFMRIPALSRSNMVDLLLRLRCCSFQSLGKWSSVRLMMMLVVAAWGRQRHITAFRLWFRTLKSSPGWTVFLNPPKPGFLHLSSISQDQPSLLIFTTNSKAMLPSWGFSPQTGVVRDHYANQSFKQRSLAFPPFGQGSESGLNCVSALGGSFGSLHTPCSLNL